MNKTNYDSEKFDKDAYGNLIPKRADVACNSIMPANLEQDIEIIKEYGLED